LSVSMTARESPTEKESPSALDQRMT
jgi:hypothetical protein